LEIRQKEESYNIAKDAIIIENYIKGKIIDIRGL
jgi:hypothetical protein